MARAGALQKWGQSRFNCRAPRGAMRQVAKMTALVLLVRACGAGLKKSLPAI